MARGMDAKKLTKTIVRLPRMLASCPLGCGAGMGATAAAHGARHGVQGAHEGHQGGGARRAQPRARDRPPKAAPERAFACADKIIEHVLNCRTSTASASWPGRRRCRACATSHLLLMNTCEIVAPRWRCAMCSTVSARPPAKRRSRTCANVLMYGSAMSPTKSSVAGVDALLPPSHSLGAIHMFCRTIRGSM